MFRSKNELAGPRVAPGASGQPRRGISRFGEGTRMLGCVLAASLRFGFLSLLPLALLVSAGCATALTTKSPPAEQERALLELRAKNAGYVRRIEELENRIFILEDQLDSRNLASEQKAPAVLPARKNERSEPNPNARLDVEAKPLAKSPSKSAAKSAVASTPVKAPGEASPLRATRSEDNAAGAGETSIVAEHSVDYTGDAVETRGTQGAAAPARTSAATARPLLRLSAAATGKDRTARIVAAAVAPEPGVTAVGAPGPSLAPDPLPAYRQALEILRAGQPEQALPRFRRFLEEHPQHDYADNAQYWIGECHYAQKQFRPAERAFRNVVESYPRGNKVPDAMLKLGFALQAVGDEAQGHAVLESLTRAFPKHEAARLASERLAHPESPAAALSKPTTFGTVLPLQAPSIAPSRPAAVSASPPTGRR